MDLLDIQGLLTPIDGENSCGQDLRETSNPDYQTLKDTRRAIAGLARSRKFDSDANHEINTHWQTIFNLAPKVIKEQAKDLEVAAWLTESALRLHGYAGLRAALTLSKGLVNQFWDNLYPLPDEDGIETRVYPLSGLNGEDGSGTLILPLKNVELSEDDDQPFTFNLYSRCLEAETITDPEARQQRNESIGMTIQAINSQVNASSNQFYQSMIEDIEVSLVNFNEMTTILDEKCGLADSPPSSAIKKTLEGVLETLKSLTKNKLAIMEESTNDTDESNTSSAVTPQSAAPVHQASAATGPIASRQDALNNLLLVANYFRQTEPHSPLCGALERVVKWGNMSLQALMIELIPDPTARANYSVLTGIDLGEDALPIGQLSQSAKTVETTQDSSTTPNEVVPEQAPKSNDFGQEENLGGW